MLRNDELMGKNWAYPLWLYPRVHVQLCDHQGSHPIGQWSNHMVFHQQYQTSDNHMIHSPHPSNHPYLSAPISTFDPTQPRPLSHWVNIYFWLWLMIIIVLSVSLSSHIAHHNWFHLSSRLCAPLVHSFSDSSSDVSLLISLMGPLAFVLCWFIHSHDPLQFQFAHKLFSHFLSPFVFLSSPIPEDISL